MLSSVFAIVLTLLLVIGLHEAGHALAAYLLGVKIQRIAIGFGKPVISWTSKKNIQWVWSLWLVGGYVRLLNSRIQPVAPQDLAYCFDKKPIWVRCIILVAGALANLIVALVALTLMYMIGYKQYPPIISQVIPNSFVAQAGMQAGDRIKAIGKQKVESWQDVAAEMIRQLGSSVIVILESPDHKLRGINFDLSKWRFPKRKGSLFSLLGIDVGSVSEHKQWIPGVDLWQASQLAGQKVIDTLLFFMIMLKQLFTAKIPFSILLGPIGFLGLSVSSFIQGLSVFLSFIAMLSLSVCLVNLLPIPGLDGGSILYLVIEKIRGEPISIAWEILLYRLAMIIFCLFLVQLILNDLYRYLL